MSRQGVADSPFVMNEMPQVTPSAAANSRPKDVSKRRRRIRRRPVLVTLAVLLVSAAAFAWWAEGRGYKTALFRRLFPENPAYLQKPTVFAVRPADREGGVEPDAFIAADVNLPNTGRIIDRATLIGGVQLLKGNAREKVPAMINTTGGGDAIILRPLAPLELNALYTFEVLPALKDTGGAP